MKNNYPSNILLFTHVCDMGQQKCMVVGLLKITLEEGIQKVDEEVKNNHWAQIKSFGLINVNNPKLLTSTI